MTTILRKTDQDTRSFATILRQCLKELLFKRILNFLKLIKELILFLKWDCCQYLFQSTRMLFMTNQLFSQSNSFYRIQMQGTIIGHLTGFLKLENLEDFFKLSDYQSLTRCYMMWDGMRRKFQKIKLTRFHLKNLLNLENTIFADMRIKSLQQNIWILFLMVILLNSLRNKVHQWSMSLHKREWKSISKLTFLCIH